MKIFNNIFFWYDCLIFPAISCILALISPLIGFKTALIAIACCSSVSVLFLVITLFIPQQKEPRHASKISLDDVAKNINLLNKHKKEITGEDLIVIFKSVSLGQPLPFSELDPFGADKEDKI